MKTIADLFQLQYYYHEELCIEVQMLNYSMDDVVVISKAA